MKKYLFSLILFLVGCASSSNVQTSSRLGPQDVYFAGVSFTGDYKDNNVNYPYSYKIVKSLPIDRMFVEKSSSLNNPNINLTTSLGDTRSADAIALSLAIDFENVTISQISQKEHKLIVDVYAQILLFDFTEKKIINTYPLNVQYITIVDYKPSTDEISSIIQSMYTGANPEIKTNILDIAVNKMNTIDPRAKYGNRLRVNSINIEDNAKKVLLGLKVSEDWFKTMSAQSLSKYLTDNQGVAVLPYIKGQAIGSKMAARFVNGDIYNLEIPMADYVFDVTFRDLKSLSQLDRSTQTYGFFVYTNIVFKQPDLNKTYMDMNFRGAEHVILLQGQQPDSKASYVETMMNLFDKYTKNISKIDSKWFETVMPEDQFSKAKSEFREVQTIVNKCK